MAGKSNDNPVSAFFAQVADAAAEISQGAVADIRQKLVEEPWFDRAVTAEAEPGMAERLGWAQPGGNPPEKAWNELCDRLAQERGQRAEPDPSHEHDLDHGDSR